MDNRIQVLPKPREIEKPLFLMFVFMVGAYSVLSVFRHWHFQTSGYDLGIFDQVIWHYSRFETPACSVNGYPNILGDHFHPALMFLAPIYWILPKVEVLLIVQAVLLMLPIFPIFLFTKKRLGRLPAYFISASYCIFWGIQYAAIFDFHEVSMAVPLTAFGIYCLDEQKKAGFWFSVLLLPFVKEEMCLLVVCFSIYMLILKRKDKNFAPSFRECFGLMSYGLIMFGLEVYVVMPIYRGGVQGFPHWVFFGLGTGPLEAVENIISSPFKFAGLFFSDIEKIRTFLGMFAPYLFFPFFSPVVSLGMPFIAEKMLADGSNYHGFMYHYAAVLSPVLAMAAADGLRTVSEKQWTLATHLKKNIVTITATIFILNCIGLPLFRSLRNLGIPSYYILTENDLVGREALKVIPLEATVLAQDAIIPHLSHRSTIESLRKITITRPTRDKYIIVCQNISPWPILDFSEIASYVDLEQKNGYEKIFEKNGWIVLEKSND